MSKKILLLFVILFNIFFSINVFADSIPVENIFSDIKSDYKYIDKLQVLYDKGMIFPDSEGKFNPYKLLTREEFVGIAMEVSCNKCIKPNTSYSFLKNYTTKPFFDVDLNNKYFYCISDASYKSYVNGYDISYTCDDKTYLEGEKPFCINNNIVLEEAIAIILRVSGILSNGQAENIRNDILTGKITKSLSNDVSPKNLDGTVYSFYPDFMKALEYEVVEYDNNGNQIVYNLLNVIDGKLRPKKNITKEEFLSIAYVALKANNCIEKNDNNLSLEMNIYDSICNENAKNCNLSNLNNENIYDFESNATNVCESGINNPEGYIWRFHNTSTNEEFIKYGKYIDNYNFEKLGIRKIYLRVIDNCGNSAEVYNTIFINNQKNLVVSINANPIFGKTHLKVDLEGIVYGENGPYDFEWDFGNKTTGFGKNQVVIYKQTGLYENKLKVTDNDGNTGMANVFIKVDDLFDFDLFKSYENINTDLDGDGIINGEDSDIDGDGLKNSDDPDIDGDGLKNSDDPDIDGDGLKNSDDLDIDGDGINNSDDTDIDGDGINNSEDSDIDGDGLNNSDDPDIDGDGLNNSDDPDIDGDGLKNGEDSDVDGSEIIEEENDENTNNDDIVETDTDNDGINDDIDLCPLVTGELKNNGCPIISNICDNEVDCSFAYVCNKDSNESTGVCELNESNINDQKSNTSFCNYSGGSLIKGNITCINCPCTNSLDYTSILRECDIIFPAITSPDKTNIYSIGEQFQIK